MASNYSTQVAANRPATAYGGAKEVKSAWGSYEITDSGPMAAGSFVYLVRIPKGAYITQGRIFGDPIDSSGSGSALASVHIGMTGAFTGLDGTAYTGSSATTVFASSLALGPDCVAVTGIKATNTRNYQFGGLLLTNGPLFTTDECLVYVYFTASALALTTGTLAVEVNYYQGVLS